MRFSCIRLSASATGSKWHHCSNGISCRPDLKSRDELLGLEIEFEPTGRRTQQRKYLLAGSKYIAELLFNYPSMEIICDYRLSGFIICAIPYIDVEMESNGKGKRAPNGVTISKYCPNR